MRMNLQDLVKSLNGRIILPSDAEYEKARLVFSGEIDRRPGAIVRVANTRDVQKTIAFTRDNNLEMTIRSGGHSGAGFSIIDDGIMLDLRDMRNLKIDENEKTAWVETGLTSIEVTNELDKHNLVLGFGDTGSVGVGGITLGGGSGFLVRKFGLTIDNLLAAEIVTSGGEVLEVEEINYPDLFWAIRGGGGNFGVVTKFKFGLHDLDVCYGGMLLLPPTADVISGFVNLAKEAPDELSTIINIMPTPPMTGIPDGKVDKLSVMCLIVYAGDPQKGEQIVDQMRALGKPIVDMVKPMRYKEIYFPEDANYHPKSVGYNFHMETVDHELAAKIIAHLDSVEAPMKALQLRVLGGAMARVADDATAYGHRKNNIMGNIATFYETEVEMQQRLKWADEFLRLLDQGDRAVYVNFLNLHDYPARLKYAYPELTWKRLVEIKKKYDPTNFFHNNANIS